MTNAILITFFPTYLVSLGYSKTQIGIIFSIGPTMGIFSNLFWGFISDKYHTLKKTILAVLIGQLIVALVLFQVTAFGILFILMTFFYFFHTPLISLNDSQLLLHTSASGKSYASYRVWGSIGFAFSALVFGFILNLNHENTNLIAILAIGTISLSLLLSTRLRDNRSSYSKIQFSGLYEILMSRKLLIFLLLVLIISIAHRANDAFLSLYLHELGANQSLIGLAWTVSALSEIPIFIYLSRYGHRYKELALLSVASLIYSVRFYLMSIATQPYEIVAIQVLHSLSFGIFLFTAIKYMLQLVPEKFRATGQAIFTVVWSSIAGLISSTVGGILFDHWGGRSLYQFSALVAIIACGGFLLAYVKNEK